MEVQNALADRIDTRKKHLWECDRDTMEKIYLDMTELETCSAVFSTNYEIICSGTTLYSMPVQERNAEYLRYGEDYDIHFIFDDNIPQICIFTVPHIDIFAIDSKGGYIGTLGQATDLQSNAPICYIDEFLDCYLIAENGSNFLEVVSTWKQHLRKINSITVYHSKSEAEKSLNFIDLKKIGLKSE